MKLLSMLSLKAKIIAGAAAATTVAGTVAVVLVLSSPDAFRLLKVFEMTGKSIVTRVDSGAMDAYTGMNLESGDIVEVGETSTMTLSLDNNKYLSLDPNTVLELIAEGTEQDSKTTVNLRSGGVLNEITEPLSDESSYSVNTPKATMAVRGTSFYVSVKVLDDGSYITDVSTFHGKVEIQLIDEEGNPRGEPVTIEPNESVSVLTIPAEGNTTGAEVNGTSMFILRKSDGSDTFAVVGEGEDPVMPLNVLVIPASVIERVLNTHDNTEIVLSEDVLHALLGENYTSAENAETTAASETTAETTVPETTTTVPETTVPETTVTEETVVPSETTVPETTVATTTVPTRRITEATTTVPETTTKKNTTTTTKVTTTVEETTVRTEETTTAAKTTGGKPATTTEATTTTVVTTTEAEPAVYTVTFISNPGGEMVAAPQEVEAGGYAEEPTEYSPSININGEEYTFWGFESPLGPITADTDILVKYVKPATVFSVYVTDDGTTTLVGTYDEGGSFTLPQPAGKTGATFKYWGLGGVTSGGALRERGQYQPGESVTADRSKTYEFESNDDTNIRFEAVYEDKTPATITYVYNGVTYKTENRYVGDSLLVPGFDATAAGIPAETSYTFNGYKYGNNQSCTIGDTITIEGDLTLNADIAISVTVTFLDYDGTVLGTAQGYQGESVDLPADPTREGYSFTGWLRVDNGASFDGNIPADATTDFSVKADYLGDLVTITFTYNGNTYATYSGDLYRVGEEFILPEFDYAAAGISSTTHTFSAYTYGTGELLPRYPAGSKVTLSGDRTYQAIVTSP